MVAYCILNQEKPEQVTLGCILHQATGNHCRCCTDYQAGKTKPAYPVPAIPIAVTWNYWPDHSPQLWSSKDGETAHMIIGPYTD